VFSRAVWGNKAASECCGDIPGPVGNICQFKIIIGFGEQPGWLIDRLHQRPIADIYCLTTG
jgi:hypothetical protein